MFAKIFKIGFGLVCFLALLNHLPLARAENLASNQQNIKIFHLTERELHTWIKSPFAFTSLAVKTNQPTEFELRLNQAQPVIQTLVFEDGQNSTLVFNDPAEDFLLSVKKSVYPKQRQQNLQLTVYLFNTVNANKVLTAGETSQNGLKIISRLEWGADENLRYTDPNAETSDSQSEGEESGTSQKVLDCNAKIAAYPEEFTYARTQTEEKGNKLKWPLQYAPSIQKIVVHHTGENSIENGRPSDEMMRAIYYYHTIVRGWGDIGYNYVIGKDGEIFEGRAGGEKVVGAHAYCNNVGTIGVSVMGNFEQQAPSQKQLNSLKALLSKLAQTYNLKPDGSSIFHGKTIPNIVGHRDLASTACPGKNLYSWLPSIRADLANGFTYKFEESTGTQKDYAAESSKKVEILKLSPTHQKTLIFTFKNTGKKAWEKGTWLHIALNNNRNAWAEPLFPDKNYVAADMRETKVEPNQSATFEVTINTGYTPGFFILEFAPVVNNKYKLSSAAIMQPVEVDAPKFTYEYKAAEAPPHIFYAGEYAEAWVELKNTGNIIWRNYGDNKMYLGTANPQDRESVFSADGRKTRLGYLKQREVKPGEIGRFVMPLNAPSLPGNYTEAFAPVIEGVRWLEDKGMQFEINVQKPNHKIVFLTANEKINLDPGEMQSISLKYQNLSDVAWDADQVHFKLAGDYQKLGLTDNIVLLEKALGKKEQGTVKLHLQAPMKGGNYKIAIVPALRGTKFDDAKPLTLDILVKKPIFRGILKTKIPAKINLKTNQAKTLTFKVQNLSNFTWMQTGDYAIKLASTSAKNKLFTAGKWEDKKIAAGLNEKSVAPNQSGTFTLEIQPAYRGFYSENFKLKIGSLGFARGVVIPIKMSVLADGKAADQTTVKPETATPAKYPVLKSDNPTMRILLSMPEVNPIVVTADQTFNVVDANQKTLLQLNAGESASVIRQKDSVQISAGGQSKTVPLLARFVPENNGIVEIKSWAHQPSWNQNVNDNRFRGILELRLDNDHLIAINELPLEDYLKGIAEVSNNDPTEKLKTMAVIARSYALFYLQPENEKFPGKPYDGSDDPNVFQKYLGYSLELRSPNFVKAVAATQGEVVKYQGKLVKTPYFNQSDGRTRSAQEVWGWTNTPYLVSVSDPDCAGLELKGHGVGLSGYGATQMAKRGKTYQEIIRYYYTGVAVEKD